MNEAVLKSNLVAEMRTKLSGAVVIRHEDHFTAGIPDISITWYGRTTWLEVKHVRPRMKSRGIQELTMRRLEGAGYAKYVIYDDRDTKRVGIVRPRDIVEWETKAQWFPKFDHNAIVEHIRKSHQL